jgi:hypothetical protein
MVTATVEPASEVYKLVWSTNRTAVATVEGSGSEAAILTPGGTPGLVMVTAKIGNVSASAPIYVETAGAFGRPPITVNVARLSVSIPGEYYTTFGSSVEETAALIAAEITDKIKAQSNGPKTAADPAGWRVYVSGIDVENDDDMNALFKGITDSVKPPISVDLSLCHGEVWENYPGILPESKACIGVLTLPASVTEIQDGINFSDQYHAQYATFKYYENLKQINGPGVSNVGTFAFWYRNLDDDPDPHHGPTNLTIVNFPAATNIESYAFGGLPALVTLNLPAVRTVEEYAFRTCTALETVNLPAAQTIGLRAFLECTALKSVNLPLVRNIDLDTFSDCTALEKVNLPAAVRLGHNVFDGFTALETVNLPKAVYIGENGFRDCTTLKTVDFPALTGVSKEMFSCLDVTSTLKSVNLPAAQDIGINAFRACIALENVNIPVAKIIEGGAFVHCSALRAINLPAAQEIHSNAFQDCYDLESVTFGTGITTIASNAFKDCYHLESVTFGTGVTTIASDAFSGDLKAKYEIGGAGTYHRTDNVWTKVN